MPTHGSESGIWGSVVLSTPSNSAQCLVVDGDAWGLRFAFFFLLSGRGRGVRLYRAIRVLTFRGQLVSNRDEAQVGNIYYQTTERAIQRVVDGFWI